jgi:hypothetical protein
MHSRQKWAKYNISRSWPWAVKASCEEKMNFFHICVPLSPIQTILKDGPRGDKVNPLFTVQVQIKPREI